jgi:hypothetical protein
MVPPNAELESVAAEVVAGSEVELYGRILPSVSVAVK